MLNCHYFLRPNNIITYAKPHYFTITPEIIRRLLFEENLTYYAPTREWLIQLDHVGEATLPGEFKKVVSYVLLPDMDLLRYETTEWFKTYWNKPFLVSNPIYLYDEKLYIFSNKTTKAVQIDNHEASIMEQITQAGAYAIGNGVNIALSLVTLGFWTERQCMDCINSLDHNNHLYHTFPNHWTDFLLNNPCHPADHLSKFAFTFNSLTLSQHLYYITQEDMFLYHMPQRHMTTITSLAKRKDQINFAKQFKACYIPSVITPRPDIYHHLTIKDFPFVAYIIETTEITSTNVLFALADLYKKRPPLRRHLKHLWRFLIKTDPDSWSGFLYDYFVDQIVAYDEGKLYPRLPKKLLRDTYFLTHFLYDDAWKILLTYIDKHFHTHYQRLFDRKKIHRLKILKNITQSHPEGHTIEFIMKDFLQNHPAYLVT